MATARSTQSKSAKSSANARDKRVSDTEELSGERDEHYNLISVLYHGLQGADQCSLYAEDADDAGDSELAEFLRDWGKQQAETAQEAKQLLLKRLGAAGGGARASSRGGRKASEDEEDEDEDDDDGQ